jgi:integrase
MRGQGRVFERGDIPWIAYCFRGKEWRESAADAIRAAESKARRKFTAEERRAVAQKLLEKRVREVVNDAEGIKAFVGPQQYRVTIGELLDDLEADLRLRAVRRLRRILSHIKRVRGAFGDRRATDIGTATVDRYIESRLSEANPPAHATVNRETGLLAQAFKLGVERQRISAAPKVRKLSEKGNARQGFFEQTDFDKVVKALPDYLKGFAQFAYYSGWRRGEICSLEWSDVDMLARIARLRPEHSKTREGQVLSLAGDLWNVIVRQWALREFKKPDKSVGVSAFLFHRKGKRVGDIRVSWRAACKAAKVEGKPFHDLRRTAVRNMVRAGVPERVSMAISGHKTCSMFDRYNIVAEDDLRKAVERTQAYLNTVPAAQGESESKATEQPATVSRTNSPQFGQFSDSCTLSVQSRLTQHLAK